MTLVKAERNAWRLMEEMEDLAARRGRAAYMAEVLSASAEEQRQALAARGFVSMSCNWGWHRRCRHRMVGTGQVCRCECHDDVTPDGESSAQG